MRIAIDLTPLLPGGKNGGAKIMTLQLVKHLALLARDYTFLLLANDKNFPELINFRSANVEIINTSQLMTIVNQIKRNFRLGLHIIPQVYKAFIRKQPWSDVKNNFENYFYQISGHYYEKRLYQVIKADLLFCPFTAPYFKNLNIPIVSVIYDLQSHYHSQFFSDHEREERARNFNEACSSADILVCISNFVRQTVLDNSLFSPDRIKTVYIRLAYRLPAIDPFILYDLLKKHQLKHNQFLLYPANFWPHKNHLTLFNAFRIYLDKNPNSNIKLVCTGADSKYKIELQEAIKKLQLEKNIYLTEFLSDREFASFMHGCLAMIFPSLYEGFGMPTLEAMVNNKPVLCSNLTSLPEIVGDAALLFDPHSAEDIANAIQRIIDEPKLREQLIQLGKIRVETFGTEAGMAKEYLDIFNSILTPHKSTNPRLEHA